MKLFSLILFVIAHFYARAQDAYQLAPPRLKYESVFFNKEISTAIEFAKKGTTIHFTTNGTDPTENDAVYKNPIVIVRGFTTVKARVFEKGFLPSETSTATFIKQGVPIANVHTTQANKSYLGSGANSLTDNEGGINSHSSNTWMGFDNDTVRVTLTFKKATKIKNLLVHTLQHQAAWIFLPQKIEVFHPSKNGQLTLIGSRTFDTATKVSDVVCVAQQIPFDKNVKTTSIVIQIYSLPSLPEWHDGKGKHPWIFIDEVKVY